MILSNISSQNHCKIKFIWLSKILKNAHGMRPRAVPKSIVVNSIMTQYTTKCPVYKKISWHKIIVFTLIFT